MTFDRVGGPYRALFDRLRSGAARLRPIVDGDRVVDLALVEHNPAFGPFRELVPHLRGVVGLALSSDRVETVRFHVADQVIAVTAYPSGSDEVIAVIDDVTADEELAARARESESRFRQAFHANAAAMVIAQREDLRILDVNARWLEMFGATREEVIGRTSVELGLIDESAARSRIAQHRERSGGFDAELQLFDRSGTPLTVLASARPIMLGEGICTLTTLLDITARKQAEEAFAVAFRSSPAAKILVDTRTEVVVAVNDRMVELTGRPADEMVGRDVVQLALIAEKPRAELLAEIQRTGRVQGVEVVVARADGGALPALVSTETITLNGAVHRLTVFTDITDRKRFERRLIAQHAIGALLAEAPDLGGVFPHVLELLAEADGWRGGEIWLADPDDGALRCRGKWRADAEVADAPAERITRALASVAAEQADGVVAFPIQLGTRALGTVALTGGAHRDGVPDAESRALFDSIGRLLALFVERVRADAALRELNAELEARVAARTEELETANRELESFASAVSHDLRAPLRAIGGYSSMLHEDFGAVLPEAARALIARIGESGVRMRTLIDGLLAFSRLGRHALRRTSVALDPLIRSILDELVAGHAVGDRIDLRIGALGSCHADPTLLRAVWTNLIDNALKYSHQRDRIEVEIGRETRGDEVIYYVRDNGAGFDMRYADKLFGVFQRLHRSGEFEGSGVGLANVRRIVERHHGRVAATSQVGVGSRFEFTLGPERG